MATIQAALVIRSFAIRGFDYLRTRKQGKTANNKGKTQFKPNHGLQISEERNPANSEGNLYCVTTALNF